jgi:class 3 adenylate cyclase
MTATLTASIDDLSVRERDVLSVVADGRSTAASRTLTVLFTDVAASTELVARIGDERGLELLGDHRRRLGSLLAEHGGALVKWLGDGAMAMFTSTVAAIACALEIQRAGTGSVDGVPLALRVGLHAGETYEGDGDLFGLSVIVASRLCHAAHPGQTLCSDLVFGLVAGRRVARFVDVGAHELKGLPAPMPAYRVDPPTTTTARRRP